MCLCMCVIFFSVNMLIVCKMDTWTTAISYRGCYKGHECVFVRSVFVPSSFLKIAFLGSFFRLYYNQFQFAFSKSIFLFAFVCIFSRFVWSGLSASAFFVFLLYQNKCKPSKFCDLFCVLLIAVLFSFLFSFKIQKFLSN